MTGDAIDADRLTMPPGFEKRVVELHPHQQLSVRHATLREALIFVTVGEIEIVCASGSRQRFTKGDILSVASLAAGAVCGAGDTPAQLVVVHRNRPVSPTGSGRHMSDDVSSTRRSSREPANKT